MCRPNTLAPYFNCAKPRGGNANSSTGDYRALVLYELPLNEVVIDFHDRLKSVIRGYASFDYDYLDLRPAKLLKLDFASMAS